MPGRFGYHNNVTPGLAWIGTHIDKSGARVGGSQRLIVAARVIMRGKHKGRLQVTFPEYTGECKGRWRDGRKTIVDRSSIIKLPDED